jgi:hypothetical protein
MADGQENPGGLSIVEVSGLDLRNGSISAPRGSCRDMLNWEVDQEGGLARIKGYAVYDGTVMGPELDQSVIVNYIPAAITGVFRYAEMVSIVDGAYPTQYALCLGTMNANWGLFLVLAFPYTDYSNWVDPTTHSTSAVITGLTSGAVLSANIGVTAVRRRAG